MATNLRSLDILRYGIVEETMKGFPINVLGIKTGNRKKKERIQGEFKEIRRAVQLHPPHSISILFLLFPLVFFPQTSFLNHEMWEKRMKKVSKMSIFSSRYARAENTSPAHIEITWELLMVN